VTLATGTMPVLTGSTNNTVVTVTGADAIQGEANLTFDGEVLKVLGDPSVTITQPYNLQLENDTDSATSGDAKTGILFRASYSGTTPTDLAGITGGKENASDGNYASFISLNTRTNGVNEISERMRIDSSGNVLVGKTAANFGTNGIEIRPVEGLYAIQDGRYPLLVNRLTDDGELVRFYAQSSQEGSISVSGNTVSYNGFTGTHWSRFSDNSKPTILRGTVLESLDEMCDWYNLEFDVTTTTQDDDGNDVTNTVTEKIPHVLLDSQSNGDTVTYNHEGTDYQATIVKEGDIKHMMSKVSDIVDAKNVYGVFSAYDLDGEGYNDFYVASVGTFVVRIKSGETVAKGDLLQSNGDGTAKVQSDDNVKSSSFAKVLSTTIIETYDDGSFIVPCSLRC
jgi:hypothetical protein